jgi:hypothetical protein
LPSVVTDAVASCAAVALRRDYGEALVRLLDPISNAAFDVGRRIPNAPWREQLSEVGHLRRNMELEPTRRIHE